MTDEKPTSVILDDSNVEMVTRDELTLAQEIASEISMIPVTNEEEFAMMSELHARAKKKLKGIENEEKELLKPLKEAEKRWREFFKPAKELCKSAMGTAHRLLISYTKEVERKNEEARRAAQEEIEREKQARIKEAEQAAEEARADGNEAIADAIIETAKSAPTSVAIATSHVPKVAGQNIRPKWKARPAGGRKTYDESKVPLDWRYVSVDEKKLNAIAKTTEGEADVPGVEFFDEGTITNR